MLWADGKIKGEENMQSVPTSSINHVVFNNAGDPVWKGFSPQNEGEYDTRKWYQLIMGPCPENCKMPNQKDHHDALIKIVELYSKYHSFIVF